MIKVDAVDIGVADMDVADMSRTDKWLYRFNYLTINQQLIFVFRWLMLA